MGKRSVPGPADCHWNLTPACKADGPRWKNLGIQRLPLQPGTLSAENPCWLVSTLLKEISAGEKPNLLPFPRSVPSRPPPPPPPGVSTRKHPSGGQNSSHKIQLERSHELLNLNTKGKTSLK